MFAAKKHLNLALRVAILCSLCNLVVAYDPKVGDMVYIQSERLNRKSGEVVRTNSMCSTVRLHSGPGESTKPVLILNKNLTLVAPPLSPPPVRAPTERSGHGPDSPATPPCDDIMDHRSSTLAAPKSRLRQE